MDTVLSSWVSQWPRCHSLGQWGAEWQRGMDSMQTEPCRVGLTSWANPSECELTKTITKQPKLGIISLMLNPCASKRLCRRNDEVVCLCACMCVVCMHVHVRVCVCVQEGLGGQDGWDGQTEREALPGWEGWSPCPHSVAVSPPGALALALLCPTSHHCVMLPHQLQ